MKQRDNIEGDIWRLIESRWKNGYRMTIEWTRRDNDRLQHAHRAARNAVTVCGKIMDLSRWVLI